MKIKKIDDCFELTANEGCFITEVEEKVDKIFTTYVLTANTELFRIATLAEKEAYDLEMESMNLDK